MPIEKKYEYWPTYWAFRDCGMTDRTAEALTKTITHVYGSPQDRRKYAIAHLKSQGRAWLGIGYLVRSLHPDSPRHKGYGDEDTFMYNPNGWES